MGTEVGAAPRSDVICDFPLKEMLAYHKSKGAEGTILVTQARAHARAWTGFQGCMCQGLSTPAWLHRARARLHASDMYSGSVAGASRLPVLVLRMINWAPTALECRRLHL